MIKICVPPKKEKKIINKKFIKVSCYGVWEINIEKRTHLKLQFDRFSKLNKFELTTSFMVTGRWFVNVFVKVKTKAERPQVSISHSWVISQGVSQKKKKKSVISEGAGCEFGLWIDS